MSARARMKYVEPLMALGVAAITVLLILALDPAFWLAHPLAAVVVFGVVMACGATFAMVPVTFARQTERFLLGNRRTYWLLDKQVSVSPGEFWTHPFHLPRNGWVGVRCTSDAPISVEIADKPNSVKIFSKQPYQSEESRKNVWNPSVYYRAGREGDWVFLIHNHGLKPLAVEVKVSEWVSAFR